MDKTPLTFQDMILELEHYWAGKGCTVMQPYDSEVGAGTFHTATTLRSLGPAAWRTCYPQPCRRPADGRYGENPNRMQHYYQFQVLIKPSPADSQELYLGSLAAIGLDPDEHDVRFVEDDWESPTLGAWGLGWEVWMDGMEVTQFTYFQQVGGLEVDPVPVEITYGLERLCMYLQNVAAELGREQPAMCALGLAEHILNGRGAARIHGGGFGGTIQAFVPLDIVDAFIAQMDAWLGVGSSRRYKVSDKGAYAAWL